MTETPKPTHRYTFAGSLDTMGDARSMNTTWTKIAAAFEALEKIVIAAGGTLTCTPQRIGTKKIVPAQPASQSAPDVVQGAVEKEIPPPPASEPTPHPLAGGGSHPRRVA
jgi:hypothetical protein